MRITRDVARKLGLDFASLWLAATPSVPRIATIAIPGEPALVFAVGGEGWWVVKVANWHPCSDNLRASSVRAWAAGKARDRDVVREMLVYCAKATKATGRRKATLVVTKRCGRGVKDPANLLKSLHDSLKTCGLVVDDDETWLDWDRPRIVIDRELGYRVVSTITLEEQA